MNDENKPEAASRKNGNKAPLNPRKVALVVVIAAVIIALVAAVVVLVIRDNQRKAAESGTQSTDASTDLSTDPTADSTTPTIPSRTYSADDATAVAAADTVIASIGDYELDNGLLQVFYWIEFYNFMDSYGMYASYYGLDYTQPLDTQYVTSDQTWEELFLQCAFETWGRFIVLTQEAEAAGFVLPEDQQESLDNLANTLQETAEANGYASAEELIRDEFGASVTMADYLEYSRLSCIAYGYFDQICTSLEATDEAVLDDYFAQNADLFGTLEKTEMPATVDVRHVLIQPENGTTGDDGYPVYSDEDWAAAEIRTQQIYSEWLAGDLTEEAFSELAVEYSEDGNASTGGIYEGVVPGQMVTEFNDWCFDTSRQPGDYDIVKTVFGYHIMYFVGASEETYWHATVLDAYLNERINTYLEDLLAAYPFEPSYDDIVLARVELFSAS